MQAPPTRIAGHLWSKRGMSYSILVVTGKIYPQVRSDVPRAQLAKAKIRLFKKIYLECRNAKLSAPPSSRREVTEHFRRAFSTTTFRFCDTTCFLITTDFSHEDHAIENLLALLVI